MSTAVVRITHNTPPRILLAPLVGRGDLEKVEEEEVEEVEEVEEEVVRITHNTPPSSSGGPWGGGTIGSSARVFKIETPLPRHYCRR